MTNKSMDYHYPAEYIVPPRRPADVIIGNAFETEFMKKQGEIGLYLSEMLEGVLVTGGTEGNRFLTNFDLVREAAIAEANYLIITTSTEWRRLLDKMYDARVFRLGEDLTINPVDPEENDVNAHATNLAHAFTQSFNLQRLTTEQVIEILQTCLIEYEANNVPDLDKFRMKVIDRLKDRATIHSVREELTMIEQFLQNIQHGNVGLVFGKTAIPFEDLMMGITILEIDSSVQQHIQFIVLCLLAKVLSFGQKFSHQRCMVLVDSADDLITWNVKSTFRFGETEKILLNWQDRFRKYGIGLHLSVRSPSQIPIQTIESFRTILAHKTTAWKDVQVMSNLLQLLPNQFVHSGKRKNNYQEEDLKTLPDFRVLAKLPIFPTAFPIELSRPDLGNKNTWQSSEIQARLRAHYPKWAHPVHVKKTVMEINFGDDVPLVGELLSVLSEYPELQKHGLLSTLTNIPGIELDMPALEYLLNRLVKYDYIVPAENKDENNHVHQSYKIKPKGKDLFEKHIREVRQRART